jgi:DNA-binding XRE family transcriptional regulator
MKKSIIKKARSASFFDNPKIKKIMSDPQRRASIEAKSKYIEIFEDIERMRKESGMSQIMLSKITRISQEELSRIERGKHNITFDTYFRIVGGLGYTTEFTHHKIHSAHA